MNEILWCCVQVDAVGVSDQIPILVAATNGYVDLVKLLHDSNANINVQVHLGNNKKKTFPSRLYVCGVFINEPLLWSDPEH